MTNTPDHAAIARGLTAYEFAMQSEGIPEIIKSVKRRISLAEDARQRIMEVPMDPEKLKKSTTTDGQPPYPGFENTGAPKPIDPATGQHGAYYILSDEERAKGFVRPVRRTYRHEECGTETRMSLEIAETYARDPKYYGATFCARCRGHFPVGENGEFVWVDDGSKVGS